MTFEDFIAKLPGKPTPLMLGYLRAAFDAGQASVVVPASRASGELTMAFSEHVLALKQQPARIMSTIESTTVALAKLVDAIDPRATEPLAQMAVRKLARAKGKTC